MLLPRRSIAFPRRQTPLPRVGSRSLFFLGLRLASLEAGDLRPRRVRLIYTRILDLVIPLLAMSRQNTKHNTHKHTRIQKRGCPFPHGVVCERASLAYGQGRLYGSRIVERRDPEGCEQRRQCDSTPLGWEELLDDQGRNGCCNILVHQTTRVGRVAGMSAIGHPKGSLCRSFRCFLTNQSLCQGLLCSGESGLLGLKFLSA